MWATTPTPGSWRQTACRSVSTEGWAEAPASAFAPISPCLTAASSSSPASSSSRTAAKRTRTKCSRPAVRSSAPLAFTQKVCASARADVFPSPRMT